jgi:hypothetical protein
MKKTIVLAFLALIAPVACHVADDTPSEAASDAGSSTTAPHDDFSGGVAPAHSSVPLTDPDEEVTWHQHIAPLISVKCGGCHLEGGIAPFSLQRYEQAEQWASLMAEVIEDGSMPPWGAQETEECTPPAPFKDDARLSQAEKQLFQRWVDGGRLEGDELNAAPVLAAAPLELVNPDRSLTIPSGVSVEGTADDFVCFTLDPNITENVWLTSTQITAGNSAIVHHALVFLDRAGQGQELADDNGQYKCFGSAKLDDTKLLGAWAPGAVPAQLPARTGVPLQPGDKLVIQVHYHPTGQGPELDDSTRIDLAWTTVEPDYIGAIFLIGNFETENPAFAGGQGYGLTTGPDFLIPAGATAHQEINRYRLDDRGDPLARLLPISVWMVGTHMHYVGTDMQITASAPTGETQCLVQTPHWDFNWQRGYFYTGEVEQLPRLHLGDSLTMRCTYNNSMSNPFVREALDARGLTEPRDVSLGEETLDEMCLGVFGLAVVKEYADDLGFSD